MGHVVRDVYRGSLKTVAVAKGEMKVIVVAAFFPPAGGVGTFRVRKFVKYLSEFGVSPAVVTMTVDEYSRIGWQMDAEGLGDVPTGVAVYRSDAAKVPFVRDIGIRWTFSLLRKLRLAVKRERPDLLMFTGDPFFPMIWGVYFKLFYGLPYVLDFRDPWALAGVMAVGEVRSCGWWIWSRISSRRWF